MLSEISWSQFLTALAVTIAIYYLYVGIKYYPQAIRKLFASRKSSDPSDTFYREVDPLVLEQDEIPESETTSGPDELDDIEELLVQLTSAIRDCSSQQISDAEFKSRVQRILSSKPTVASSPYRSSINELVVSECEKYGAFTPGVGDVDEWWDNQV